MVEDQAPRKRLRGCLRLGNVSRRKFSSMDGEEKVNNILEGQVAEARVEYLVALTPPSTHSLTTATRGYIDVPWSGIIADGGRVPTYCPDALQQ